MRDQKSRNNTAYLSKFSLKPASTPKQSQLFKSTVASPDLDELYPLKYSSMIVQRASIQKTVPFGKTSGKLQANPQGSVPHQPLANLPRTLTRNLTRNLERTLEKDFSGTIEYTGGKLEERQQESSKSQVVKGLIQKFKRDQQTKKGETQRPVAALPGTNLHQKDKASMSQGQMTLEERSPKAKERDSLGQYAQLAFEYQTKLKQLQVLLNKIEYHEDMRSIQDLQELFSFCKDKISLGQKSVLMEVELAQKKRDNERLAVEVSSLKDQLQRETFMLKKYEAENHDLKQQVFQGQEDSTSLYKLSVVQETKAKSMQRKAEGLQRGLLTLSSNKFGDLENQSRLKTTIHLLILENNTLKKELSLMKNLNEEQSTDLTRLKKKINHLVMKLGEETKINSPGLRKGGLGLHLSKEGTQQTPFRKELDKEGRNTNEITKSSKLPSMDEFEKVENNQTQKIQEEKDQFEGVELITKSKFNLQGPYWKNRTNEILKSSTKQVEQNTYRVDNGPLQLPSLFQPDQRNERLNYSQGNSDFRLSFLEKEEKVLLRDIRSLGVDNFVEVAMSRKQLDIKRALLTLTKEFVVENTVATTSTFLIAEGLDYLIRKKGKVGELLFRVNRYGGKFLKVQEVKVWIRDILNNSIWTQNQDNIYEQEKDLSRFFSVMDSLKAGLSSKNLIFPILSPLDQLVLGFLELMPYSNTIEEPDLIEQFSYECQLAAFNLCEVLSTIFLHDQQTRDMNYYVLKRQELVKHQKGIAEEGSDDGLFFRVEKCLKETLQLDGLKLMLLEKKLEKGANNLWCYKETVTSRNSVIHTRQSLPWTTPSLFRLALQKRSPIIIYNAYDHWDFNAQSDLKTLRPLNCIPLIDHEGSIFGVAQFENQMAQSREKAGGEEESQKALVGSIFDAGLMKVISDISDLIALKIEALQLS